MVGAGIAALRVVNTALANLLVIAHGGLLAYLVTAWSLDHWVDPWATTGVWLAVAGVGILISALGGAALGSFVWVANRFALRPMQLQPRLRWAKRLGWATFGVVLFGGVAGAVELYVFRPVPLSSAAPMPATACPLAVV